MPCYGWHGSVRGGVVRAREGTGPCLGGCKGPCGRVLGGRARSGRCWSAGVIRCGHARKVLDTVLTGRAPANAGRGRGQELSGRVGEHLGSKGKLQDVVICCFAAG